MKKKLKYVKQNKFIDQLYLIFLFLLCVGGIIFVFHKYHGVKGLRMSPFLDTDGTELIDHANTYTFTGFNIYNIASLPGHNAGCGGDIKDINSFFSTFKPNSMIRFWAWQGSMAINPQTKQLDWSGIDRVVNAAAKYKQKVILSLGTQSGECDDGKWKDSSWYSGGYKTVYNTPAGLTSFSYWDYIQKIVSRYKDSKTIGMWELINEPETSDCAGFTGVACYGHQLCPDHGKAAQILRQFFDTVGGEIKSIDPNHLIESGVIGTGQCGADNYYYSYVHQSPAIDVASYHDYHDDNAPMPGDQWNGLAVRLNQMKQVNKPLIIGELGIVAVENGGNCITLHQRKDKVQAKINAMLPAGASGVLLWNRSPQPDTACNYDIGNNDPLVQFLNNNQLP